MSEQIPSDIKLYHIMHHNRLSSVVRDNFLWCDAEVKRRQSPGTAIGMPKIKEQRLHCSLKNYPDLHVGDCVPFYFCPRSVMLYIFYRKNHPDVTYLEGQEPIVHIVIDLQQVVEWADQNDRRWVFTDSNAGSICFNDFNDLTQLNQLNWLAIQTTAWKNCREEKQAEFLLENRLSYEVIESIGVYSAEQQQIVQGIINLSTTHRPPVDIMRDWYY